MTPRTIARRVFSPHTRYALRSLRNDARAAMARRRFQKLNPLAADEWGLLCPYGIGDTYLACGMADALLKAHGGCKVTAFVKPHHLHVANLFPSIERAVIATPEVMSQIGERDLRLGIPFYAHFPPTLMHMLGHHGMTLLDGYRALFQVPMDAPDSTPRRPTDAETRQAAELFDGYGLPTAQTVLLAPEANSSDELSLESWGLLADAVRHTGWHPVTNTGPKGQIVPGTSSVEIPLNLAVPFVERAGWSIAVRSGLADLLSSADARQTVLYPKMKWFSGTLLGATSLVAMGLSRGAEEFELAPGGLRAAIPDILNRAPAQKGRRPRDDAQRWRRGSNRRLTGVRTPRHTREQGVQRRRPSPVGASGASAPHP